MATAAAAAAAPLGESEIAKLTDVNEIKKRLDETRDLLERIGLEDRLSQLESGGKAHTPETKDKVAPLPPSRPVNTGPRKLASKSFSAGDQKQQPVFPARGGMVPGRGRGGAGGAPSSFGAAAIGGASRPKSAALTPDGGSSTHQMPPVAGRGLNRSASQAKEQILLWAQRTAATHNYEVKNLTSSFADGIAFLAIVHHYFPEAFDFRDAIKLPRKERFNLAFNKAEELGKVPVLIDAEDMMLMGKKPDYKVMFTYFTEMYRHLKKFDNASQASSLSQIPEANLAF